MAKTKWKPQEPFTQELATYEANKQDLLGTARDQFVLIKGNRIVGTFESRIDAVKRGYDEFGNVPFLVKQIVEVEEPIILSSSFIGTS